MEYILVISGNVYHSMSIFFSQLYFGVNAFMIEIFWCVAGFIIVDFLCSFRESMLSLTEHDDKQVSVVAIVHIFFISILA